MSALDELTPMQRAWCLALVGPAQGNATKAAEIAGYKGDDNARGVQGHANMRNAKIQAALKELEPEVRAKAVEARSEAIADAAEVQQYLSRVLRGQEHEIHGTDEDGNTVAGPAKIRDRNDAAKTLARIHGLLIERREHSGPGGGPLSIGQLPADELLKIIKESEGGGK